MSIGSPLPRWGEENRIQRAAGANNNVQSSIGFQSLENVESDGPETMLDAQIYDLSIPPSCSPLTSIAIVDSRAHTLSRFFTS